MFICKAGETLAMQNLMEKIKEIVKKEQDLKAKIKFSFCSKYQN